MILIIGAVIAVIVVVLARNFHEQIRMIMSEMLLASWVSIVGLVGGALILISGLSGHDVRNMCVGTVLVCVSMITLTISEIFKKP